MASSDLTPGSADVYSVTDGNYKTFFRTNNAIDIEEGHYNKWIKIVFEEIKTVVTAFIVNECRTAANQRRMG